MSIVRNQPATAAVKWTQQLQRFSLTATNQAMGHYLRGCANVAMARTPEQALAALRKTQTDLLRHSADTVAAAAKVWRK